MLELKKINNDGIKELVEVAYRGDNDLLEHFWGDGFSFQEAVDANMFVINKVEEEVKMDYYCVLLDELEIGYVCRFPHNLYSFGINIEYRTKKNLIEFWEKIKEVMEDSFICILFPQNTRAINWLKKCGLVVVDGVAENGVTLLKV